MNDMAKVAKINEKATALGGKNFVPDKFDALLSDCLATRIPSTHTGVHSPALMNSCQPFQPKPHQIFCS